MNFIKNILIALILSGCSSTVSTTLVGPEAGAAGEAGYAGNNSAGSGSGGEAGVASSSSGGNAGTGSAGSASTGGNSGSSTGGTGGSVCTPKTCFTIGIELSNTNNRPDNKEACGIVEDGCGNYIDCAGCEMGECGRGTWLGPGQENNNAVPNLCGGGCNLVSPPYETQNCSPFNKRDVVCSFLSRNGIPIANTIPPKQTLNGVDLIDCESSLTGIEWCCNLT